MWCLACMCTPEGVFPTRFEGTDGITARWGDYRLPFRCPVCNLGDMGLRLPSKKSSRREVKYYKMALCDMQVSIDTFSKESEDTSKTYLQILKRLLRWQKETGIKVVAENKSDLESMCPDARGLKLFMVDQTCKVKFSTARQPRSALTNLYTKWGVDKSPTESKSFSMFVNGLARRIGIEVKQAAVWPDKCLVDMDDLWESDYQRLMGERKLLVSLAATVWHVYLATGLRWNEGMNEKVVRIRKSRVGRREAERRKVPRHYKVWVGLTTKEERFQHTEVLMSYKAMEGGARVRPGQWLERSFRLLDEAGRGSLKEHYLFASADNVRWNMSYYWREHVRPRIETLQRQGLGDLEGAELDDYTGNSFRRTWASLAARGPRSVPEDLMERQARWRKKMARKQQLSMPMVRLYQAPILREPLRASSELG